MEFPVTGIKVVIDDGASHAVDSSDMAFQAAALGAFLQAYPGAKPVIHEPIMKVSVESPSQFQGTVMGSLNQRRGMIVGSQEEGVLCVIDAQVPLAEMFGYSTVLRSSTQGQAQFTMEFAAYKQVPQRHRRRIAQKKRLKKKRMSPSRKAVCEIINEGLVLIVDYLRSASHQGVGPTWGDENSPVTLCT